MSNPEYLAQVAEALRSSERMVRRNADLWRSTPETDGDLYDPDWDVTIPHEDAETLAQNLSGAAALFDLLACREGGA